MPASTIFAKGIKIGVDTKKRKIIFSETILA